MNIKKLLSMALLAFGLINTTIVKAEELESPVRVQFGWQEDKMSGTHYAVVYITATSDNVILTGIRANRSSCMESIGNTRVPVAIPFGQSVVYKYMKCKEIIEADITTNTGTWTFR